MWVLGLFGCGGDKDGQDTAPVDTDTDTDADTDSDTDTDTPHSAGAHSAAPHSAVDETTQWTGAFHVDVTDSGFVANMDSCDTTLTVMVDPSGAPAVSGTVSCTMAGILAGQTFTLELEGDYPVGATFGGVAAGTWPAVPTPIASTWDARFVDADTFTGTSIGRWSSGGEQAFDWSATFTLDLVP
jgi:hypothetical protein